MALSVDYLFKFSLNLIRKNISGGLGNEEWQRFWNDAQTGYQDDLIGRFQARNNGKTGNNTGLIEDETILQKLSPFTSPLDITVNNGKATKPSDFIFRMSLMVGNFNCYKYNSNQKDSIVNSVIDPPSVSSETYYFIEYEDYYSILPNTVSTVTLDYVRTPPNVVWGYTYDTEGFQVYNEGSSTQPLWDNNSCREITKRMLKNIGVSFKDQDFENFGNSVIATGD